MVGLSFLFPSAIVKVVEREYVNTTQSSSRLFRVVSGVGICKDVTSLLLCRAVNCI